MAELRIGILVVAYNAETTLRWTLDRIPAGFRDRVELVLVSDDHSSDGTFEVGLGLQHEEREPPIAVVRQPRNLGYGGNQKFGYRWMLDRGLDVVVLLHGDGQYAPELLPEIVAPILAGDADVVLGSRMMEPGRARVGGMPLYKYVGNRVLTAFQNRVAGLRLTEWHSGYRAFSLRALERIRFEESSDGFDFDTEVLLQLHAAGARIVEIPIPTYYGDEICYVDGVAYARDVSLDVVRYRLARMGFGSGHLAVPTAYEWKDAIDASHRTVLRALEHLPPGRILDLGCAGGQVGERLRERGHAVVGVDVEEVPGARERLDGLLVHDLDLGLPPELSDGAPFDAVVAADLLEHLRDPERLLAELRAVCTPEATLVASVPNIGHWYPRVRIGIGRFDYDQRGILDATHLRLFTWRSFERTVRRAGWIVERRGHTGLPLEVVERGGGTGLRPRLRDAVGWADRAGRRAWPSLFAYQFVAVLRPDPARRAAVLLPDGDRPASRARS